MVIGSLNTVRALKDEISYGMVLDRPLLSSIQFMVLVARISDFAFECLRYFFSSSVIVGIVERSQLSEDLSHQMPGNR